MDADKITVEDAAERFGVTARTLHYYEEIGLLEGVPRTEGGHRYYNQEILGRLEHILRLKELLGISLQEIKAVLEAESRLGQLRDSIRQEPQEEERLHLLGEAAELLDGLVYRLGDRIEKLSRLRTHFQERLVRVNEKMHNSERK